MGWSCSGRQTLVNLRLCDATRHDMCWQRRRRRSRRRRGKLTSPLPPAGTTTFTTLRKQALVSEMQLRHRDLRALEPGVALPCA